MAVASAGPYASHLCKITMPAPHHSIFYGPDAVPDAKPTVSKHWRQVIGITISNTSQKASWLLREEELCVCTIRDENADDAHGDCHHENSRQLPTTNTHTQPSFTVILRWYAMVFHKIDAKVVSSWLLQYKPICVINFDKLRRKMPKSTSLVVFLVQLFLGNHCHVWRHMRMRLFCLCY